MTRAGIALAVLWMAAGSPALADSDTLLPITMGSVATELQKALVKLSVRDKIEPMGCVDGTGGKRTVCNFKIGHVLGVMAETKPGKPDVVGITMICSGTEGPSDVAKCLLAYNALMAATSPNLSKDDRGKIIGTLTSGLEVGNQISVETDERKYVLQKSVGLWFHVIAAEGEN